MSCRWVYRVVVAPPGLPVPVSTVKDAIGIPSEDTGSDSLVEAAINGAVAVIEQSCGITLGLTTFAAYGARFMDAMRLEKRPFVDLTEIAYVQETGDNQAIVDSAVYHIVDGPMDSGEIWRAEGQEWPQDVANRPAAIEITFRSGYATLPADLASAVVLTAAAIYESGPCQSGEIPSMAMAILVKYRWPEMMVV